MPAPTYGYGIYNSYLTNEPGTWEIKYMVQSQQIVSKHKKPNYILFGSNSKKKQNPIDIVIDNQEISKTEVTKFLGVFHGTIT